MKGTNTKNNKLGTWARNSHSPPGERLKQEGDVNVGYLTWGLQIRALDSHECGKSLSPQAKWIVDDGKELFMRFPTALPIFKTK